MSNALRIFSLINLGCFKNLIDSQAIMGRLVQEGFYYTDDLDYAEIIIVNTCGFINPAKKESLHTIRTVAEKKLKGNCKKLIVVGCLVQKEKHHLKELIPQIDYLLGIDDIPHIISIAGLQHKRNQTENHKILQSTLFEKPSWLYDGEVPRVLTGSPHYSFIKIAEGCNHTCSFCAIPFIKGNYRSRSIDSIMNEAHGLAKSQVKELILISQDSSFYGLDSGRPDMLVQLLRELVKIPEFIWIRLLYLYPDYVTRELIHFIADEPQLCKYFDIPFQHCSKKILASMQRAGTKKKYFELINEIRAKNPSASLRTTLIVGFPGESEKEFEELVDFCGKVKFDNLGVFIYYDEKETQSYSLPGKIPYKEKIRRRNYLLKEQEKILMLKNISVKDTIYDAIIDEKDDHYYKLRHQGMAPEIDGIIYVPVEKRVIMQTEINENIFHVGDMVKVKIINAKKYEWFGTIIKEGDKKGLTRKEE